MDKNLILKILQNCKAGSIDEAQKVIELKALYPYSQVLHVLAAKLSKDQGFSIHQEELQMAAVYSSDRSVLKDIMTREFAEVNEVIAHSASETVPSVKSPQSEVIQQPEVVTEKVAETQISATIGSMDVADTVLSDLQKLNTLKHNFEMLFADQTTVSLPVSKEAEADGHSAIKSKKERIKELAKAASEKKEEPSVTDQPVRKKKRENPAEKLIEEIKVTKEALEPESEKQKEQIEIIDHFIKKQPSIPSPRDKNTTIPEDLDTIKSGEFGENIVSETLVEILVKQGKKERAIEVLKKLIWKYPQKKAYFASQIEDLKK